MRNDGLTCLEHKLRGNKPQKTRMMPCTTV